MTKNSQTPRTETPASEGALQAEAERLSAELDELQRKHDELHEKYLRAHADFDNLRKRLARERIEEADRAQAELLMQILDAVDDLSRAVAVEATTPEARSVLEGFRLVHEKLMTALARAGLETIATDGERFDPERHEAVLTVPAESPQEEGRIVQELSRGYRFGERLLRPARVQVKRYIPPDEGSA